MGFLETILDYMFGWMFRLHPIRRIQNIPFKIKITIALIVDAIDLLILGLALMIALIPGIGPPIALAIPILVSVFAAFVAILLNGPAGMIAIIEVLPFIVHAVGPFLPIVSISTGVAEFMPNKDMRRYRELEREDYKLKRKINQLAAKPYLDDDDLGVLRFLIERKVNVGEEKLSLWKAVEKSGETRVLYAIKSMNANIEKETEKFEKLLALSDDDLRHQLLPVLNSLGTKVISETKLLESFEKKYERLDRLDKKRDNRIFGYISQAPLNLNDTRVLRGKLRNRRDTATQKIEALRGESALMAPDDTKRDFLEALLQREELIVRNIDILLKHNYKPFNILIVQVRDSIWKDNATEENFWRAFPSLEK